jgi:large subunit ribosomal protein L40
MRAACEELRIGAGDGGRLFRQAMVKKGVYGGKGRGMGGGVERGREGGVPVEYARGQTETPARDGWDEGWRR